MYKDKSKQREADRLRQQKHRQGVTAKGVTKPGFVTPGKVVFVTPKSVIPEGRMFRYCRITPLAFKDRPGYKPASLLAPGEYNRVSKPGDSDYVKLTQTGCKA